MPTPPNTGNYSIGKGVLSIGTWVGTTAPTKWTDLGNAPSVEVEHALERLPHYSSRAGLKVKDANPVIQTDYTVNFTLDELAISNLKLFMAATEDSGVLHALRVSDAEYALKFIQDNPFGPNRTFWFWKCTLTANGPLALIGDEWQQMTFTAEGLADSTNHESSPYYDVTYTTTTTTTTTTTSTSSTSSTSSTTPTG